jgi:hypothetical protein
MALCADSFEGLTTADAGWSTSRTAASVFLASLVAATGVLSCEQAIASKPTTPAAIATAAVRVTRGLLAAARVACIDDGRIGRVES